ncbi:MAG: hypothetical protein ACYSW8_32535 [Planctomycetota bacterium]|jgi:hypothetical protein
MAITKIVKGNFVRIKVTDCVEHPDCGEKDICNVSFKHQDVTVSIDGCFACAAEIRLEGLKGTTAWGVVRKINEHIDNYLAGV